MTEKTSIIITATDQTGQAFASARQNMDGLSNAMSRGFSPTTTNAIRNASYQMSDFVVQVQGGQRVSLALSQQLPQLLAGFGAFGAAAGMVAALFPTIVASFGSGEAESKRLGTALGDLNSAVGEVGRTGREFSMDNLYKQFNVANEATRAAIIEQVNFQRTLIETQQLMASQSLSKSVSGLGDFGFLDKLSGSFDGADKLARQLGISREAASDMLPSIKGLRDGTEDAGLFMQKFGATLAASRNAGAQQLVKDIKSVADAARDAAAAQSQLSGARERMLAAGSGKIDMGGPVRIKVQPEIDILGSGSYFTRNAAFAKSMRESFDFENQAWAEMAKDRETAIAQNDRLIAKYRALLDPLQKYRDELEQIAKLEGVSDGERASMANFVTQQMDAASQRLENLKDTGTDTFAELTKAVEGWGKASASAFADFVVDGKGSISDLARHVLKEFISLQTAPMFGSLLKGVPSVLSSFLPGFATGGSFTVGGGGGTDSQLVAFRATPGERVSIATPAQQASGGITVNLIEAPGKGGAVNRRTGSTGAPVLEIMVEQIKAAVASDIRSGNGAIPAALQGTYGVNRAWGGGL